MAELYDLSQTDGANDDGGLLGAPEGMARSAVNNRLRALEGALRRWYEDPQWLRLMQEQGSGTFTVSKLSDTSIRIASSPSADVTGKFDVGSRVRVSVGVLGRETGRVVSRAYADPNTDVTLEFEREFHSGAVSGTSGTGTAASPASFTITATGHDLIPGSVAIYDSGTHAGSTAVRDDGAGNLTHPVDGTVGSVNYTSRAVTINALSVAFDANVTTDVNSRPTVPTGCDTVEVLHTRALRGAAFREVGTSGGQVLLAEDVGGAAFKEEGPGNGLDADKLDGAELSEVYDQQGLVATWPLLTNGSFQVWDRGWAFEGATQPNDDGSMTADRWALLSESDGVYEVRRRPGPGVVELSLELEVDATNPAPPNSEMGGVFQILDREAARALREVSVSLSLYAFSSGLVGDFRVAILESNAVAAPPRDCISAWPAVGADPTPAGTWSVLGSAGFTASGSWQRFKLEDVEVSDDATYLGILIWIDSNDVNSGDLLRLAAVQLDASPTALPYRQVSFATDEMKCSRFFRTSFGVEGGVSNPGPRQNSGVVGVGDGVYSEVFPVQMREDPTLTTYNPSAANDEWTAGGAATVDVSARRLQISGGSSGSHIHYTADAEFA